MSLSISKGALHLERFTALFDKWNQSYKKLNPNGLPSELTEGLLQLFESFSKELEVIHAKVVDANKKVEEVVSQYSTVKTKNPTIKVDKAT